MTTLVQPSVEAAPGRVALVSRSVLATHAAPLMTALAVFVGSATFYATAREPFMTGDEPHYVVYAKSLGRGWGLDLQRAYQLENRRFLLNPHFRADLAPIDTHADRYAGPDGRFASWHNIGLPILLAPLAAVDSPVWTFRVTMMAIGALLAYQLFRLVHSLTRAHRGVVAAGVMIVMLSPPVIYFSGQVYPELIAALLVVIALRCLISDREPRVRFAAAATLAALLPWFAMRYITLTAVIAILIAGSAIGALRQLGHHEWQFSSARNDGCLESSFQWRIWIARCRASLVQWLLWPLLIGAALGLGLVAFNLALYGSVVANPYLANGTYRLQNLYTWGIGSLIGLPFGFLPLAPILLVALAAIPRAARRIGVWRLLAGVALASAYVSANAYFGSPGYSLPGRYLVSAVPLLAVPMTVALATPGRVAIGVIAAALSLTALSTVRSTDHYWDLYNPERRNIEPLFATRALWPYVAQGAPVQVVQEAPSITHQVGAVEQIDGVPYVAAREGRDAPGALAYGPYVTLQPGRYRTTFELLIGPGSRAPVVTLDVSQDIHQAVQSSISTDRQEVVPTIATLDFETAGLALLEFRVWFDGRGTVAVRRVSTHLLEPRGARDWWKAVAWMLGLSVIAIGWRK